MEENMGWVYLWTDNTNEKSDHFYWKMEYILFIHKEKDRIYI